MGKKVIKIKKLFKKFSKHVASCESVEFVCSTDAAFESWFRVELCPVLLKLGFEKKDIHFSYTYRNPPGKKADLCLSTHRGDIVLELKSFVCGQDRNKWEKYPEQTARLKKLIDDPGVLQVITFTTFIGYPRKATMGKYMDKFFGDPRWDIIGPAKVIKRYRLYLAITSMTK